MTGIKVELEVRRDSDSSTPEGVKRPQFARAEQPRIRRGYVRGYDKSDVRRAIANSRFLELEDENGEFDMWVNLNHVISIRIAGEES